MQTFTNYAPNRGHGVYGTRWAMALVALAVAAGCTKEGAART